MSTPISEDDKVLLEQEAQIKRDCAEVSNTAGGRHLIKMTKDKSVSAILNLIQNYRSNPEKLIAYVAELEANLSVYMTLVQAPSEYEAIQELLKTDTNTAE